MPKKRPQTAKYEEKGVRMKSFKEWSEERDENLPHEDNSGRFATVEEMQERARRLGLKLIVRSPAPLHTKEYRLVDPYMKETIAFSMNDDWRAIHRAMDNFERRFPKGTYPWGEGMKENAGEPVRSFESRMFVGLDDEALKRLLLQQRAFLWRLDDPRTKEYGNKLDYIRMIADELERRGIEDPALSDSDYTDKIERLARPK
jgi:hypothetical protein